MIRTLRILSLTVMVLTAAWTLRLITGGGFSVVLNGHLVRSNDPWKPFVWAVGAAVAFALTGGGPATARVSRRIAAALTRVPGLSRVVSARGTAVALAASVTVIGIAYMSTVASGADGSGYVSQADRWIHGRLKPPQPWVGDVPWPHAQWTFSPLGYKPVEDGPPFSQAPTYAPGLPLMMAGAKIIGGQAALFLVVPLCGGILVLATFGIARRLRGPACGVIAAWLVATSPIVIWMLIFPMSDVPVGAAWTTAFLVMLSDGIVPALSAGLLAALAILIRPNLFFLAPIMGIWFLIRRGTGPTATPWSRRARDLLWFMVGVAPGPIFIALLFKYLFGSPTESGYGRFSDMLAAANVWPNLRLYFHWAMDVQRIFTIVGLAGVVAPFLIWPKGEARRAATVLSLVFLGITAEYAFYIVFDDWTFLRFFVPAWPILAVGAAGLVMTVWERLPAAPRLAAAAALVVLGATGVRTARDRFAFELWHGNRRYTAAAMLLARLSPPNSVAFSMEDSGSIRYYSGRLPLRWDEMPEDWLDRSVDWLTASGVHTYAVLDEAADEVGRFRDHFKDQRDLRLIETPVMIYQSYHHGARIFFYDLTTPPAPGVKPTVVTETDPGQWRNWPAGPLDPTLVFHPQDAAGSR